MSNFILLPAQPADCEAISFVEFAACAEDPGFSTIFPHGATPETLQNYTQRYQSDLKYDPTCHIMVVKDVETGEVASFATWHFFPEREQDETDNEMLVDDFHLPSDANVEAGNRLIRNGIRKRHEIMGTRSYACRSHDHLTSLLSADASPDLAAIGTSLKYRRQGAASLLLEWGTKVADEYCQPAYVEGTPAGISIYRKYGFEHVDRLRLELSPWMHGDFWNVCMIRPTS